MNTKFNLGSIEVKVPAGEFNPEINVAIKDISYEVTDMSLTEYGAVLKTLLSEGTSALKDFAKLQEESKQREFEREQMKYEMRMQEIKAQTERDKARDERRRTMFVNIETPDSVGV